MLVLDETYQAVDRIAPFTWKQVERERMTTVVRFFGRLAAYLPQSKRAYYVWSLIITYRPEQHISFHQYSPPHLRLIVLNRWEFGLVLGSWIMGMQMGQRLAWFKRVAG
jgi:hypothetical protein